MKLFKIYPDSNKYLRTKCEEVSFPLSDEIRKTILDMVKYVKLSQNEEFAKAHNIRPGVGLSANQIGITKRFFAMYLVDKDK